MTFITRLVLLLFTVCLTPAYADVYDKPLSVKKMQLRRHDPENPAARHELTCYSYPGYTVKENNDSNQKGAILSIVKGSALPCREAREPGEYVLPADVWSGYYAGAKSGYVFVDADDGFNSGMGFIVLRVADNKKVFEDVYQNKIESITMKDGVPQIRYRRVYASDCSILADGAGCAASISRETGVSEDLLAICNKGYRAVRLWEARARCTQKGRKDEACIAKESEICADDVPDRTPSVVVYEVEADLHESIAANRPLAGPSLKALGNAMACRPAD